MLAPLPFEIKKWKVVIFHRKITEPLTRKKRTAVQKTSQTKRMCVSYNKIINIVLIIIFLMYYSKYLKCEQINLKLEKCTNKTIISNIFHILLHMLK